MAGISVDDWFMEQFRKLDQRLAWKNGPLKKIAILSTPRSGSSFFCESLAETGLFGLPEEWLNPRSIRAFGRHRGMKQVRLNDYFSYVLDRSTSDNGVFSIKIHVDQYQTWRRKKVDLLTLPFDNIIYVYRKDKFAQAYSYAKALQTDQWRSYFEPKPGSGSESISKTAIAKALWAIVMWEEFYEINLSPRVDRSYCYEEIIRDDSFVRCVLDECAIEKIGRVGGKPKMALQRSTDDQLMIEEFKRYVFGSDR